MLLRRSLFTHLLWGLVGAASFVTALRWEKYGWPALLLFPVALFAWRGCPTCWIAGLFEFAGKKEHRGRNN